MPKRRLKGTDRAVQPPLLLAKKVIAEVLRGTGILALLRRRALRGRAVVLMYHRVVAVEERGRVASHESIVVDAETFELHMRILQRMFSVIALEEFLERLRRGSPFRDGSCLITFDDGWRDNHDIALPILEHYGLPATVFLSSGFVGTDRRFWQERLAGLLAIAGRRAAIDPSESLRVILQHNHLLPIRSLQGAEEKATIDRIVSDRKRLPLRENEALIERLASELGAAAEERAVAFLTWDEARAMQARGVSFGCHGVSHRLLTELPPDEVRCEILDSRVALERQLGLKPRTFSYPNGYHTPAIAAQVRECGFEAAFGTTRGLLDSRSDRYALARVNISGSMTRGDSLFLSRVLGVF